MRARAAVVLVLLAVVTAGVAGCGGGDDAEATTTQAPTAAPTAPATAPSTAPVGTASTSAERPLGAADLPPADAVSGVNVATVRRIPTATEFVDVLYQNGDPAKPAAVQRLEDAGYAGAVLRDQVGADPDTGIALLRSYAIRVSDADAAQQEVDDAVEEVRASSNATTTDIDVGIPGGKGLRVDVAQGGVTGAVVYVTFPVGDVVYGIQGVATTGGGLPQDEIVAAAQALATKAGAAS